MNDLYKALGDISSIRKQVASFTEFRGYGPMTLATTSVLAMAAAAAQAFWVTDPAAHIQTYLVLWIATAFLCASLTGVQMYNRTRRIHSSLSNEMLHIAVEQFLPSVGTGLLMTFVLLRYVPSAAWMLPGLWQILFSLGVFASCRFLPRPMLAAGAWYLFTGLACLAVGGNQALSPLSMGISYGAGQMLIAGILFLNSSEHEDEA